MGVGRGAAQSVRGAQACAVEEARARRRARGDRQACGRGRQALGHAGVAGRRGRAAGARGRGVLGARPVRVGWARLVFCAPGSVLTRFLTQF